jgi:hypothetical protein
MTTSAEASEGWLVRPKAFCCQFYSERHSISRSSWHSFTDPAPGGALFVMEGAKENDIVRLRQ